MSFFEKVPLMAVDPIFGLTEEFSKDPRKEKWNLSIGVFRDEHLRPVILHVVKQAEEILVKEEKSKEYLPIDGSPLYLEEIGKLTFGEAFWKENQERIARAQTVGGTGAVRLGSDLIKSISCNSVLISDPTWPNHPGVFSRVGFEVEKYPYYDLETASIDWENMLKVLKKAKERTVVILQPCCHNPSGMNLTAKQWQEVAAITKEKKLTPFFDFAYQGFGKGLSEDTAAFAPFKETEQQFLIAYSCSKNFSLYCERTGALFVVSSSKEEKQRVQSAMKILIRNNVSNPPAHGARIVEKILCDEKMKLFWKGEVEKMRSRIDGLRQEVSTQLRLPHIAKAEGMFGYLHLTPAKVEQIKKETGIYMTPDSRVNLAALNAQALEKLKHAIG
jgi:aromatic-amino-acid transaminase